MNILQLIILGSLILGSVACDEYIDDDSADDCTQEAKSICRELRPGIYMPAYVGRQLPDCKFESFPDEVDNSLCQPCRDQEKSINEAIEVADYCEQDSDCAFSEVAASCEFMCGFFHNQDASITDILTDVSAYRKQCIGDCGDADCAEVSQDQIKCVDKRCTI